MMLVEMSAFIQHLNERLIETLVALSASQLNGKCLTKMP